MKQAKARSSPPAALQGPRRNWGPHWLAAATLVLASAVLWHNAGIWQNLPAARQTQIRWQAYREAGRPRAGLAAEGQLLAILSESFTDVWMGRRSLEDTYQATMRAQVQLTRTNVGTYHTIALQLLRAEREGMSTEARWLLVQPFLRGLPRPQLHHFLPDYTQSETEVLLRVGAPPSSAPQLIEQMSEAAHGPFLQYFTRAMLILATDLAATGKLDEAEACEQAALQLLRHWVLTPGPLALRLLTAELLAEGLAQRAWLTAGPTTMAATAPELAVVIALRNWRALYREAALRWTSGSALLTTSEHPCPYTDLHVTADIAAVLAMLWSGALRCSGLALFLTWLWLGAAQFLARRTSMLTVAMDSSVTRPGRPQVTPLGRAWWLGLGVGLVVLGAWVTWGAFEPPAHGGNEVRRVAEQLRAVPRTLPTPGLPLEPPRTPWVGAVGAVIGLLGAVVLAARGDPVARATAAVRSTTAATLLLSIALLCSCQALDRARSAYEKRVITDFPARYAELPGLAPSAEMLAPVRAWTP